MLSPPSPDVDNSSNFTPQPPSQDSEGWQKSTAPRLYNTMNLWNHEFNQTNTVETLLGMVTKVRQSYLG